jgi:hypothetical protein
MKSIEKRADDETISQFTKVMAGLKVSIMVHGKKLDMKMPSMETFLEINQLLEVIQRERGSLVELNRICRILQDHCLNARQARLYERMYVQDKFITDTVEELAHEGSRIIEEMSKGNFEAVINDR